MGLLKVNLNNQKLCMTRTILWHRSNRFLRRHRFVRAADPLYCESWQSDICCFRCMIWPLLYNVQKGPSSDPANYRPISQTSIFCKLMGRVITTELSHHLLTKGTRAHHRDEKPERDLTYHLTCLLIYRWTTTHLLWHLYSEIFMK